jgi:hypothetical protein
MMQQSAYRRLDLRSPCRSPLWNASQSAKLLAQHRDGECLELSFACATWSDDPTSSAGRGRELPAEFIAGL